MKLPRNIFAATALFFGAATVAAYGDGSTSFPQALLQLANTWAKQQTFSSLPVFSNGIALNSGGQNTTYFGGTGISAPGGSGEKIQLYGTIGTVGTSDYAFGINAAELWTNLGNATGSANWYFAGTLGPGISANGVTYPKLSAAPTSAPGAGRIVLFAVAGTNSGTAKLQVLAGTSTTPVTVVDNVGAGF